MKKIISKSEYFNPLDTLSCGQVFRYKKYKNGYLVFSEDKVCYLYLDNENVCIETEDDEYFYNYFDLSRNYFKIYDFAINYGNKMLSDSARYGKGIRILKQSAFEMIFTFIISQNNNIKRITSTVEKLCEKVGKKCASPFGDYYAFPTLSELENLTELDYKELGFGYRGKYFISLIENLKNSLVVEELKSLSDGDLYKLLTSQAGVGDKVASCIMLFGFFRTSFFPVDTWIEKIYIEDFKGSLKDRKKMSNYFISEFGEYSGYVQQYLFHYKRIKSL